MRMYLRPRAGTPSQVGPHTETARPLRPFFRGLVAIHKEDNLMKTFRCMMLLSTLLSLTLLSPALRATAQSDGDDLTASDNSEAPRDWLFSCERGIALPVVNGEGELLGTIEEFVIDVSNGDVRYAALEFSPVGVDDKLFAVPLSKLVLTTDRAGLVFRFDEQPERLQVAPGFSRDQWPNVAQRKWAEQIDIYYGVVIREGDVESDFGTDPKAVRDVPRLMRSQSIEGQALYSSEGGFVGTFASLVMDFKEPSVRVAMIDLSPADEGRSILPVSGSDDADQSPAVPLPIQVQPPQLVPVPWNRISVEVEDDNLRFVVNPDALERFKKERSYLRTLPYVRTREWASDVEQVFDE